MNTASCLAHLRELAKKAESPAELVPWLTADVLTAAGWTVHTNRPKVFIGATKQDGANDLEIRVSVVNQTIGGSITRNARRQESYTGRPRAGGNQFTAVGGHTAPTAD